MNYPYYNKFYLEDELARTLSSIISEREGKNYVCMTLVITIPEHKGLVFRSPLDGYNPWGGGLNALSGAQINYINETYGEYVPGTIPEEKYGFFVVVDDKSLKDIQDTKFKTREEIEETLNTLCAYCAEYRDISFDSAALVQRFPYLEEFFSSLDEWRAKTGRVTLDNNVIEEGAKKILVPKIETTS